jgi:uncharacterized protein YbaP (TraB family)
MKKLILLVATTFSVLFVLGQDTKFTNTLLWRISGNGLTKPSYLFGTMHLTDKRIFQLGDSVYKALEQTDGFAAELDMNRIGSQMINQFLNDEEQKNETELSKIKDMVSAETWNKYKELLEKKFNKKADKITVGDLDDVESKLKVDIFKKGDMPTFLDAWLSGQARKQGKWIGGVEDFADQVEYLEDIETKIQMALFDDDYYREGLEWFIKIYTGQKLDTIDALMYRSGNGRKDYIMIKRNIKMARRMDSLSAIRSTLFAVGAAHLPGDSGVITLLRGRGFTVTPVISSKKINPDKYISNTVESAWVPVVIKSNSYALQMPGYAEKVDMFESMGLEMKMFYDLSFMKMYMTVNIELSEERRKLGIDSLYNSFKSRYVSKGKLLQEKKITMNGTEGREYRISSYDSELKMQIFIPNMELVILNALFAFNDKSLTNSETEKFFQSFVFNKNWEKPVETEKVWKRMNFPRQSFSIEIPVKPKETKDVVSEEGKITYRWQAVDIKEQVFFGMNVSTMNEGMIDTGADTAYFINIKERLKENFDDAKVIDSSFMMVDNYPGYILTIKGKTEGELFHTKIVTVLRGGIRYYIFAVHESGNNSRISAERFINSFKLLPYGHSEWKTVTSPEKSFTTTSPFSLKRAEHVEDDIHPGAERYIFYDSLAYVTGFIDKSILQDWFWYSTDTGFLRLRSQYYSETGDSVADYKIINAGKLKAVSFTVMKPGDHFVKKVKLILNGNELYEVFGHFAVGDLPGKYSRFFDDFRVLEEKPVWNKSQPKVNELEAVLRKADLEITNEIKQWWDVLEFKTSDVPAIQKMALRIYPDFDSTYYSHTNLNKMIFNQIYSLDSNHTTVGFIINNYASIQPADELVKGYIISYLANTKTAESYGMLKDCLLKYPLNLKSIPYFGYLMEDSLKLTATLFPEIMKLAGSEVLWEQIVAVTSTLYDSNLLEKRVVNEYAKYFIETAKKELAKGKTEIEEEGYKYSDLIKMLGVIGTPEAIGILNKFANFNGREIRFNTLIAMLECNSPVDSRTIYTLATTDEYRHNLYDELKRLNKLKLFPSSYLSQKELGKSKLYEYASEDELIAEMISVAGERTILYKGKLQKFYLYKVSFSDDEGTYLGVAGPYHTNLKDYTSTHDATGLYWEEEFNVKEIDKFFRDYLDSLEEIDVEKPPPSLE